jgi:hypothetical protein
MANNVISTGGVIGSPSFAQADKFLLSFSRLPTMTLMCQSVNLPGVRVDPAVQPTQGANAPIPGNKFHFAPMEVSFLVDEDLFSWTCIFDWLQGIGFPDSSDQYKNLNLQSRLLLNSQQPQYSGATLTYFDNQNNPIIAVEFDLMFPTALSGLQFDVKQPATTPMVATAEFHYTKYVITRFPQTLS